MRTLTWLSTLCRALYWLPLCLCFLSSSANAASVAPTGLFTGGTGAAQFPSVTAYCQSIVPSGWSYLSNTPSTQSGLVNRSGPAGYTYYQIGSDSPNQYRCNMTNGSQTLYNYGDTLFRLRYCATGQIASATASQVTCTACPSGFVEEGGSCVPYVPPPQCPSAGTSVGHTLITGDITGSASIAGTQVCISNPDHPSTPGAVCGVQCNSGAVSVDPVTGVSQMYCQSSSFTGSSCSGGSVAGADPGPDPEFGEEKEPSGNCPPGTASGQINDLDVCLPSGSTVSNDVKKVTQGNKTLTTTKNQTVNPDGSVTTTITNIYNDGTTSTSSTTTTTDDKINAGGNDSSNNGGKDGSEDMPIPDMDTSLGGFEALPTRVPDNPVFSTSIISTSATCPPPITFTVMDVDLSIDFEPICDLAPMIRAIMLILAGLVALRVVVSK